MKIWVPGPFLITLSKPPVPRLLYSRMRPLYVYVPVSLRVSVELPMAELGASAISTLPSPLSCSPAIV